MNRFSWLSVLAALAFWFVLVPMGVLAIWPIERTHMRVNDVQIGGADRTTTVGESIPVWVDREIWRTFEGSYRVTLRIRNEAGLWEYYCTRGETHVPYLAGSAFPRDRDLQWWMGIPSAINPPCVPPTGEMAGSYMATVTWFIPIMGGAFTVPLERTTMFNIQEKP